MAFVGSACLERVVRYCPPRSNASRHKGSVEARHADCTFPKHRTSKSPPDRACEASSSSLCVNLRLCVTTLLGISHIVRSPTGMIDSWMECDCSDCAVSWASFVVCRSQAMGDSETEYICSRRGSRPFECGSSSFHTCVALWGVAHRSEEIRPSSIEACFHVPRPCRDVVANATYAPTVHSDMPSERKQPARTSISPQSWRPSMNHVAGAFDPGRLASETKIAEQKHQAHPIRSA